jgi:hypothetical protein
VKEAARWPAGPAAKAHRGCSPPASSLKAKAHRSNRWPKHGSDWRRCPPASVSLPVVRGGSESSGESFLLSLPDVLHARLNLVCSPGAHR